MGMMSHEGFSITAVSTKQPNKPAIFYPFVHSKWYTLEGGSMYVNWIILFECAFCEDVIDPDKCTCVDTPCMCVC